MERNWGQIKKRVWSRKRMVLNGWEAKQEKARRIEGKEREEKKIEWN